MSFRAQSGLHAHSARREITRDRSLIRNGCFVEYNEDMPPVETPTLRVPRVDPHLSGAGERVKEAAAELERLGIANPDGTRIREDLPKDMRPDADRDFGG